MVSTELEKRIEQLSRLQARIKEHQDAICALEEKARAALNGRAYAAKETAPSVTNGDRLVADLRRHGQSPVGDIASRLNMTRKALSVLIAENRGRLRHVKRGVWDARKSPKR